VGRDGRMVNPTVAQIEEAVGAATNGIRSGSPIPNILTRILGVATYNHCDITRDQAIEILSIAQQDYFEQLDATGAGDEAEPCAVSGAGAPPQPPQTVLGQSWDNEGSDWTDLKIALRIVNRFGEIVRYCPGWSRETPWFWYDGVRWVVDTAAMIHRCYYDIARDCIIAIEAGLQRVDTSTSEGKKASSALVTTINRIESTAKHTQVLGSLSRIDAIVTTPEGFDTDHYLLNVENYTYNLHDHVLSQHNPVDRITKLAPVEYDPAAECPQFITFLERIQPDPEVRAFLQRWFGYCLTGNTTEQCLLIFYGTGGNGKGVLVNTIAKIMGDYTVSFELDAFTDQNNEKADLIKAQMKGARLVSAVEMQKRSVVLNEGLMKRLTGGDEVTARVLYGMPFRYWPTYKVVLSLNHPPIIKDTTYSMVRRIFEVPFEVTIPPEERDRGLSDRLLQERPGILKWMLEGLRQYQIGGLQPPQKILEATQEYFDAMNVHADFISTCLILDRDNPDIKIPHEERASEVRKAYLKWCKEMGMRPIPPQQFPYWLRENGINQIRTNAARVYRGILIKPEWITIDGFDQSRTYSQRTFR